MGNAENAVFETKKWTLGDPPRTHLNNPPGVFNSLLP